MVAFNQTTAREILEKKIENGRASAMALVERVNTQAPVDAIAQGANLRFGTKVNSAVSGDGANWNAELALNYNGSTAGLHTNAISQLAQRAGIPSAYANDLACGKEWQRKLLAGIFNEHYHQGNPDTRYLVRRVDHQVRGFLSDRYRRIDSRPLIEALSHEAEKVGAVPVDGTFSDTRVALKAIVPKVYEPIPGEAIAFGIEWSNSDFGNGTHAVRAFMLRVWCLNGATMENALAQVHLGRRLSEDIELSQETYMHDTRASISALRDVIAGTLSPAKIALLCAGIEKAHEEKIDWKQVNGSLAKKLLKTELKAARDAFESSDNYNLPEGQTMWRASNAVSWIAGQKEVSADRKLELQRVAGELVDGRRDAAVKE